MAKVNLLTLHYADNNGSALQTYATCKILEELGHDVTLIDLQNKITVIGKYRHLRAYLLLFRYFKFWIFRKKYLPKKTKQMFDIDTNLIPPCDYTVVGSDQVWNSDFIPVRKGSYFLNFVKDGSKKIALSSSFGKAIWDADEEFTGKVKNWLSDFSAISVRESKGVEICNQVFSVNADHLVDPTMALGDYSSLMNLKQNNSKEIRCFLFKSGYSYKVVEELSRREGLPVRVINKFRNKKDLLPCHWKQGPIEWLSMIRDAKIWVTDSFHGTVFAILFHKQFISLCGVESRLSRIESLLDMFGLRDKLVLSLEDLQNRYEEVLSPIDYNNVDAILKRKQQEYRNFIKKNLS